MTNNAAYLDESTSAGWERTLYAFLAEKERRSGSQRTVQSYSRMLHDFLGRSGKKPNEVDSQDVFTWAYDTGLSGKQPGSITIGARVACLSSFYRFLIRMKVVASNPCDALERPKVTQGVARGLTADQIHRPLVLTDRRRAEVLGLRIGDIIQEAALSTLIEGKAARPASASFRVQP